MAEPQETKTDGSLTGWIIVIALSACIIGWGLMVHDLVKDSPRHFDFGQLPDAPSESVYTTSSGQQQPPPRQIVPLPEAGEPGATPMPESNQVRPAHEPNNARVGP